MPGRICRPSRQSNANRSTKHKDQPDKADHLIDQLERSKLGQGRVAAPVSPILLRLFITGSEREAVHLLRTLRKHMPHPGRKVGRPQGVTRKIDPEAVIFGVLIDKFGCSRAQVLRALGRNPSSGSKDFPWLQRRLTIWREFFDHCPPEARQKVLFAAYRCLGIDPERSFGTLLK